MWRKSIGLGILVVLTGYIIAQDVRWATKVIDYSSELTPIQHSANQALNKPNVLPNAGENPNAWTPKPSKKLEFIKVGFDQPMKIKQIVVGESNNPGSVYQVYTYDANDNEYLINTFTPKALPVASRLLNVFLDETPYEVHAVKIVLDVGAVPGLNSIDAIGLSASNIPVKVTINVAKDINEDLQAEPLGENVNSEFIEYSPLLSPDGKTLFFSRRGHPENMGGETDLEDIWYSEYDEESGEWSEAKNIGSLLNNSEPNFINSVSKDGNTTILVLGNKYNKKGVMTPGVSITRSTSAGGWSKPVDVKIEDDYNHSPKAHYYLSNDQQALLMSVERDDTYGDRDLYVCFRKENNTWTKPLNLGATINTAGEESGPFLAIDDQTLYFSSNGYSGFGGVDIYFSKRLDDTWQNWSEPENLGSSINSERDDLFFHLPSTGKYAYYSRSVSDNNVDIYRLEMPLYKEPVDSSLLVQSNLLADADNAPVPVSDTEEERSPVEDLETAKPVAMDMPEIEAEAEKSKDEIDLDRIKAVLSQQILFDFNKSGLSDNMKQQMEPVVAIMMEFPTIEVGIVGHTDSVGGESYNLSLSKRRASTVHSYLVNGKVEPSRLSFDGDGEANPIDTNETDKGRQNNRRVQFKLLKY